MKLKYKIPAALLCVATLNTVQTVNAQNNINRNQHDSHLLHGIQQYEDGHYVQAIHSLESYLGSDALSMIHDKKITAPNLDKQKAMFYMILSKIRYGTEDMEIVSKVYIENVVNTVYRDRVCYQLAKQYFYKGNYDETIKYYEMIDINNLNNDEIAELKFELAYSYFVNSDFDKSYQLFAAIKELENGKYYYPGNYYFGLLAYNKKQYNLALNSFRKVESLPEYSKIVPYYMFEIYYFNNDFDKIIAEAPKYLNAEDKLFYHNDLNLLLAKVYYEKKEYDKALPYYKYYYDHSDKIRKENLYEYAFTNYSLGHFNQAIELFRPLSSSTDSLGQNSMYLLGDSYLKIKDKEGAKNAFLLAHNMDLIPAIQESSHFLYAKLAYDLGEYPAASQSFNDYIEKYPTAKNRPEAQEHLVTLLSKSKNYEQAYAILSNMSIDNKNLQSIYQSVALNRALQVMKSSSQKEATLEFLNESLKYPVDKNLETTAHFWRSYVLYDMKEYQQSEADIQKYLSAVNNNDKSVTKISPEASIKNARTHLGYVQMALEKYDQAQTNFATAGNIKSSNTSTAQDELDNIVLQADAAFMKKDFKEAKDLYTKALNGKHSNPAYLLYQNALIAGLDNQNDEKIESLSKVVKDYPHSPLKDQAQYELAATYNLTGQEDRAIPLLKELSHHNDKNLAGKAMIQLANAYQKKNDPENAIATYETFIKTYPHHPNKEQHLETLYAIYIAKQDPKGYQDFIRDHKIETTKNISDEQGYFDIAEAKYLDGDYNGAVTEFLKFQKEYPNSSMVTQADYYLAQSYSKVYKYSEAQQYFEKLTISGDDGLKEMAYSSLAKIQNINGDYEKSMEYLGKFYQLESRSNVEIEMLFLELKNLSHLDAFDQYENVLSILEEKPNLTQAERDLLELYSANSDLAFNPHSSTLVTYEKLMKNSNAELAAEARVRKAQLLLKLNQLTDAEKAGDHAIDNNNDYSFWLVKSYIVIAEVLAAQGDFVSARATIQSVLNNVKDPILKQQGDQTLLKINELEASKTNVISE